MICYLSSILAADETQALYILPMSNVRGESIFSYLRREEVISVHDDCVFEITKSRCNRLNDFLMVNNLQQEIADAIRAKKRSEVRERYMKNRNERSEAIFLKNLE